MTLCPSFLNFTAVSTIDVRIERRGSWVFSSTMELVPGSERSVTQNPCLKFHRRSEMRCVTHRA